MDPLIIGALGAAALLLLLFLGVPIAFAMASVGIIGTSLVVGFGQAMAQINLITWQTGTDFIIVCIPLFILMGQIAGTTGIADDLYDCLQKWIGRMPGGLGVASVLACGGFGAITGSSVASVATMGTVVYPEMRKYGYSDTLSTGVLAASGTLGILIPPSLAFAFIGTITDVSIAALFVAGIIPGILTMAVFSLIVVALSMGKNKPSRLDEHYSWGERLRSLKSILPVAAIFALVVGTLYGGITTPTEAAGIGAVGTILVAAWMRKLTWRNLRKALWDTGAISAFIFAIIVGGYLLARFLAVTGVTDSLVNFVNDSEMTRTQFIVFMVILYLVLGAMLDVFGMTILTLPFIFPITMNLGIDPVWLGVFVVVMTEVALITPPVGVNVFVIKGVATDVPMGRIFKGIVPFLMGEFLIISALVIWPDIALWLPAQMK